MSNDPYDTVDTEDTQKAALSDAKSSLIEAKAFVEVAMDEYEQFWMRASLELDKDDDPIYSEMRSIRGYLDDLINYNKRVSEDGNEAEGMVTGKVKIGRRFRAGRAFSV